MALPSVMVRIELWKSSFLRGMPQGIVIELDQFRLGFATIDDARHFGRVAQAAARTTAFSLSARTR